MKSELSLDQLCEGSPALAHVLDALFDGVYVVNRKRKIIFWNRGAEAITGYSAAEVAGRSCAEDILNHIDETGRLLCRDGCPIERTLETGEEVRAKIYPLHRTGRRFPVMTHIAPIRDDEGDIVAAIEVFRDISNEEEFRLLQEKFDLLVRRYVSHTTYEEIVAQASESGGSSAASADLTIFYLDMAGFTPFSERHDPEEVVKVLNNVFGMCGVITRERHGDIDKFIGDALLATFLDANDAVAAARALSCEALPAFNRKRQENGQEAMRVRIGIHSGVVLQGDIGSSERKDRTVIGDVVNVTQRIESRCEPDSILISEAAFSRLNAEESAYFELHGDISVKGRGQPVRVYRLRT